jgi:hypothetical protein
MAIRQFILSCKIELRREVWRQGLEWYLPILLSTPRTDDMRQMIEDLPPDDWTTELTYRGDHGRYYRLG